MNTERKINEDNYNRFIKLICELQKLVKEYPEITMAVTNGSEGFKDGVGYLFIPEAMIVPKPLMHGLYTLTFTADETELVAGRTHRFVYIIRNVYAEGMALPGEN